MRFKNQVIILGIEKLRKTVLSLIVWPTKLDKICRHPFLPFKFWTSIFNLTFKMLLISPVQKWCSFVEVALFYSLELIE